MSDYKKIVKENKAKFDLAVLNLVVNHGLSASHARVVAYAEALKKGNNPNA